MGLHSPHSGNASRLSIGGLHYTMSSKGSRADDGTQLRLCSHARVRQGIPSWWQPHVSMISPKSLPFKAPKPARQFSLKLCVGSFAMNLRQLGNAWAQVKDAPEYAQEKESGQFRSYDTAPSNKPQQLPLKINFGQDTPLAFARPGMRSPAACRVCI